MSVYMFYWNLFTLKHPEQKQVPSCPSLPGIVDEHVGERERERNKPSSPGFTDEPVGVVPVWEQIRRLHVVHSDIHVGEGFWEKVIDLHGDVQDVPHTAIRCTLKSLDSRFSRVYSSSIQCVDGVSVWSMDT